MDIEPLGAQGTAGPHGLKRKVRREFQTTTQSEGELWSERGMLLSHDFKGGADIGNDYGSDG